MGIDNEIDFSDYNIDRDIINSYNNNNNESPYICNYKTIPGYDNYIIYRDGKVKNIKKNLSGYLKHIRPKNGVGPRVNLSKNKLIKSFLVSKILISTYKTYDYDFIKDKAKVHYKDHNPRNISLENIFIELK